MKQNKLQQPFMLCSFKLPCLRYMGQVMRKLEERNGMAECLLIKLGMESSLVFLLEPNICMDTLISGLEDFVPFEFKNNSHCFYGMKYGRNW